MGTVLQNILRSLCLNTDWNYAVFWRLKHRSRMVLTWEDAYHDNCERQGHSENKCSSETQQNFLSGPSHDPVGLAVARMSYHVYSLGEGIVGQVAISGKYQWIFADKLVSSLHSSFEVIKSSDGWQSQFSAGIKTVVVVAIVPYGVVQLGSLNTVFEDVKLVVHIKDAFSAMPDSSSGHTNSSPMQCSMKSTFSLSDLPPKSSDSEFLLDCISSADKSIDKKGPDRWLPVSTSYNTTAFGGNTKSLQLSSNVADLDYQKRVILESLNERMCEETKDLVLDSEYYFYPHSCSSVKHNINLYNSALPGENCGVDLPYFSESLESSLCNRITLDSINSYRNGVLNTPESSNMRLQKDKEKLECQNELSPLDTSNIFLKFSAGCELQEALGPAFLKGGRYFDCESEKSEGGACAGMLGGMTSSQLTSDSGSENLLEAVVANVCSSDVKSEQSFCKSEQSLLTSQKMPEASCQSQYTLYSMGHSTNQPSRVEEDTRHCLNTSELCGALSSQGLSSACLSSRSEQLDRNSEPAKNNKKRSRPGESSRPRPRDRQLIQDRIKELRELVPNGSKCSIDSLLERTIKHMLFLQSIAKHADKLKNCADSKLHHKGTGMPGSSNYEQGSSWAVEVGSHLKVCSIIVENLNQKGQMLVEMLCEECSHFLEIAEAIKSLNLTILKGITEAHGEKTWICFVVEGQNNRIMHRMDILWSLVKILQPASTN
ncbi:transcription factor EMB1444-like isoform X1 [Tripterygium wilfordii]|uniref:transcription factor EMB1444-like isoform X1 n=1 Tax=Tripterygium wilfordii TaxID=458696 RepID=UPI0018F7EC6E|nr:transcription factor EMB1444-like isoform X1 [Tripterygium wilfordii]